MCPIVGGAAFPPDVLHTLKKQMNRIFTHFFKKIFRRSPEKARRMRTLVFTSGTLGDTIVLFPVISAIRKRFPDDEITVINKSIPVLSASPLALLLAAGWADKGANWGRAEFKIRKFLSLFFSRFIAYDRVFYAQRNGQTLAGKLRKDGNFFRRLSKTGSVFGLAPGEDCRDPNRIYPTNPEMVADRIRRSGLPDFQLGSHLFPISDAMKEANRLLMAKIPGLTEAVKIAVSVGGQRPIQHYPLEKYREALETLLQRHPNAVVCLIGGRRDREDIAALSNRLPAGRAFTFPELENDLFGTLAFYHDCQIFIGNDTGSVHLAAAGRTFVRGNHIGPRSSRCLDVTGERSHLLTERSSLPALPKKCLRQNAQLRGTDLRAGSRRSRRSDFGAKILIPEEKIRSTPERHFFAGATEKLHFPLKHPARKIRFVDNGRFRRHPAVKRTSARLVIVRPRKRNKPVGGNVFFRTGIEKILLQRIVHFRRLHAMRKKPDVVDVRRFAERMRLYDERARRRHQGKHRARFHPDDLRMRAIPRFRQIIDEEIRPLIGMFHAEKNFQSHLFPEIQPLAVIGKIKVKPFLIRRVFRQSDVAVEKMVGDENAVVSGVAVKKQRFFDARAGATAHG